MYFFYFYPLGLDRPQRGRPVVTRALEVLMVLAFVWLRYAPQWGPLRPWTLVFVPGNEAPWTVVTAVFLHLGWLHLLGNLVYFHVFGPPLESRLGGLRFLVYLLLMGAAGNILHGVFSVMGWLGPPGLG
ncbi:MAG: rhomboid family intramembrane serine protease, partial [Krumholzibacteria bacterium]|nr:rhomboid family intramembrane serine protease [Candidatus Krumholzibacteria bacterium]